MIRSSEPTEVILPGSTIGILGSGQLGRMMALSAKSMGYRVHVLSPSHDSPCGQVADLEVLASFNDLEAVEAFARHVDVITVETENIPVATLRAAARHAPAFPGERALTVCQNRRIEKQFLVDNGVPTCQFRIVRSLDELRDACAVLMPAILKTTTGGYDGKGQAVIESTEDIETAWNSLNTTEAILEERVAFDFEFSIVAVRNAAGRVTSYPSIRNEHENGILDISVTPSGLSEEANRQATLAAYTIMSELDSVGVLTVEFFYRDGECLVNEMAPRPHNSGHLTTEGHMTSQFEQHIRAVCGLNWGSTQPLKPVAMANILGAEWTRGEPNWQRALSLPNSKLHLYGKGVPEPGRKMGHLCAVADSPAEACEQVIAARRLLNLEPVATRELKSIMRESLTSQLGRE